MDYSFAWFRRTYTVRNGYLRPDVSSSAERYLPLEGRGTECPLFLALAGLNSDDDAAVEQFVGQWGLLGLYQHRVAHVRFAADRNLTEELPERIARPDVALPFFIQLVAVCGSDAVEGIALTWRDAEGSYLQEEPWEGPMRHFFPDVNVESLANATGSMLSSRGIGTDPSLDMWDYLCEPIADFRAAVWAFFNTYSDAVDWSNGNKGTETVYSLGRAFRRHLRRAWVNGAGIIKHPQSEGGSQLRDKSGGSRWELRLSFSSLLTAAYFQLLTALELGYFVRFCANLPCGRPMVTDRANTLFCSKRCQNTANRRAMRERNRTRQSP